LYFDWNFVATTANVFYIIMILIINLLLRLLLLLLLLLRSARGAQMPCQLPI
jgi:hypothetical protein